MAERNCKFFSPNYFNPTKCQNCFKPKEQHSDQIQPSGNQTAFKKSSISRNTPPSKTVLKESVLYKACLEKENTKPEAWEKQFFRLYSNGELQEFAIVNSQVDMENINNTLLLQDFIRMLDGKREIEEDLCFGIKTLRNIYYFKTISKVDYENWWKEVSSFVAAPIKRSASGHSRHYSKPNLTKQLSLPLSNTRPRSPTTRSSRSSSNSSTIPEIDGVEMESLRGQVSKLEEENTKLAKSEEQRRKLELEVNYWKEYVTNAQQLKRSGGSIDTATELAETRKKLIHAQDEVNETQKRLKMNSGKLIMQNRELNDTKLKLQEANSLVAVYKAKIEQMSKELVEKNEATKEPSLREQKPLTTDEIFYSPKPTRSKMMTAVAPSPSPDMPGAQELEDKFLVLKDKMKRIEKELFLKSKELEKANESRFKVAKYTRSLLQELESRLSDTQQKLNESEDKLKHSNTELKMERERRLQLEEGPRRRMSSVASPPKPITSGSLKDGVYPMDENSTTMSTKNSEFTEHDADTKYADYYRSRFKEAEGALLEKDKKLHQAEEKIKQIQTSMKSNSDSYKVINELQTKLSDATHKLSDRQLKIHELTREIDRLKGYEKTYEKKTQQCNTLEEIVKDLEKTNNEQNKTLHQSKQELEILKIREVVLKEQLQTLLEDSDDEEDDDDEDSRLNKSIELKNQINCMVELEAQVKKLTLDNEELTNKNTELEHRLRNANIQHFKTIESGHNVGPGEDEDSDIQEFKSKIKELESKLASAEDRHCDEMSNMKEKHYKELAAVEKDYKKKTNELTDQLNVLKAEKELNGIVVSEDEINELRGRITMLNLKVGDLDEKLRDEIKAHKQTECTLAERSNLVKEMEAQCQRLIAERDAMKSETTSNRRDSYGVYDDDSVEGDERVTQLSSENHELKVKVRQLERKLRVSLERYEDIVASMREKGLYSEGKEKDRDSGIVITQEIKSLMDSFKKDDELLNEDNYNYSSLIENLSSGVSHGEDPAKKYQKLSANLAFQLKELGKKFILSEEKSIELTIELEQRQTQEDEYLTGYNYLLSRIEDLNQQIIDSQEVLQSEADELDLERKNVLNLVEVTSAYIKELEGSLGDSKIKIQDLQETVERSKSTAPRPIPEGEEGDEEGEEKDKVDGLCASKQRTLSEEQVEDMKHLQGILTTKVITLETEISELKEKHAGEIEQLKEQVKQPVTENDEKENEGKASVVDQEEMEELLAKIDLLQDELDEQKESFENDITNLTERFQEELKSAFGNDQGSVDVLTRMQELEVEMLKTKRECDQVVKETKEQCEKEKQQMKDDMATVLQATLSSMGGDFSQPETTKDNDGGGDSSRIEQLEDRIIELEQELIDIEERYEEELEMEKKTHQAEMEDTIRDMMMVRAMSSQCADSSSSDAPGEEPNEAPDGLNTSRGSIDLSIKKKIYNSEEVEAIKCLYEKKISAKEDEHQEALDQVRNDMAIVISSLKQGSSSDTILELQSKIKVLEQAHEDTRAEYEENLQKVEMTLKKSESKNFFAFRRNEEMGAKIYQMQTEIEELDRKHSLEIHIYQERLSALGGGTDIDSKTTDVLKANAELEEKVDNLQLMLNTLRNERENEMETLSMQLQEEKRAHIEEMTDKVLKLEAIIDDMKESHAKEMESFEKILRDAKFEASSKDNKRIEELEALIEGIEKNHEKEIVELAAEHKKVVEELRHFYEKEISDIKKRSTSDADGTPSSSRKHSADQIASVKQVTKELTEKHQKEIESLRAKFEKSKKLMEEQQEREITDIRTQYDEKLKIGYKEGLRRQSVSERRSDGARMRELIAQKEAAESKHIELELKYENLESRNNKLQKLVSELKSKLSGDVVDSAGLQHAQEQVAESSSNNLEDEEAGKKLKEIQEQIERYQRRIEYYREKSQRENTEESHRVSELQSEIVELHKEMNNIKETRRKQIYEKEKRAKAPGDRTALRRNTDGSTSARRHTDSVTTLSKMTKPRDPRKRWSNLEERSEKEEGKFGTVSARKTLWESIQDETSTPTSKTKSLPRVLANVR